MKGVNIALALMKYKLTMLKFFAEDNSYAKNFKKHVGAKKIIRINSYLRKINP